MKSSYATGYHFGICEISIGSWAKIYLSEAYLGPCGEISMMELFCEQPLTVNHFCKRASS